MGNFFAHIFPGSTFFLIGWWYFHNILKIYHKRGTHTHQNVYNALLEGFAKILLCLGGMITECNSAKWMLNLHNKEEIIHSASADWQHFTMYLVFLLTGIFDIFCVKYGNLGRTISHMSYIFAYITEACLFYSHFQGKPVLDAECHKLISYSGLAIAATLVYCLFNSTSIIASCFYCSIVILHGLWFIEVAFLILSPFPDSTWNVDSHAHALLANVFFWWTFIGIILLMVVVAMVTDKLYGRKRTRSISNNIQPLEMDGLLSSEE